MSRLPIDRLFLGYVALTGAVALVLGGPSGAILAFVHAAVFLFVWRTARWQPRAGLAGFVRASYPVLIAPVLYAELATLNRFATEGYFDATVIAWEEAIFGVQPSIALAETFPWLPLSEFLHLGYFAYYAIVPAALIGVFRTRGFDALQR
ncbi:MAG: hypothetical protein R3266_06115, partial [Gemmatimonadota bacterium]|nr:hypothetical protein [Gemmatimonadota bacterium]